MTDKDIIKALECCIYDDYAKCHYDCPYKRNCRHLTKDALDLITHQQAEIERLKAKNNMAVEDIQQNTKCFICKNLPNDGNMTHCTHYSECGLAYRFFKWRGEE